MLKFGVLMGTAVFTEVWPEDIREGIVAQYKLLKVICVSTYGYAFLPKKVEKSKSKKNADPKKIEGLIMS